jgi:hypothetical protein
MRESYVPGTLSLCDRLGAAVVAARASNQDPVTAVAEILGGRVLAAGKVTDVERRTSTGFARGQALIEGVGDDAGRAIKLSFQNEHLLVEVDEIPQTSTPDLIIVLDSETGEPVTTEGLRYGMRVRIVTAPSDPRWHRSDALALVGPRYFGYDMDAVPFDGFKSNESEL